MTMRLVVIVGVLGASLALCSCGSDRTQVNDGTHHDETTGWVGPFGAAPAKSSDAAVEQSRKLDEIQHAMDDGLYDRARHGLKELIEAGCQHPTVFYLQARLLYQQGNYEQALPWCDRAIASGPYWIEPRIILAQSYIHLKRLAAAESVFGDLDRLAPQLPWGPYGAGVIALMRGDQARAIVLLDQALARDPHHAPSLQVRAELAQGRDPDLEENLIDRFLALEPDSPWAYVRLGELALAAGHLDDARRAYLRAYALQPDTAVARRLAELAQRLNDTDEAHVWQTRAGIHGPQPAQQHANP